jgi:DNA-binding XRE family transcriptional regulator
LELSKAEKTTLLRSKDENILELKRRTETLESEIENYQNKIIELGQKLELNQDQFARTVRALRLALTNLEVSDGTNPSITIAPLKKAE